jgi:hypothetical protein
VEDDTLEAGSLLDRVNEKLGLELEAEAVGVDELADELGEDAPLLVE